MIVVEWKLTTFLRQEPWLDAPPRTRGVARLRAARGATGDPTRAWWRVQPQLLTQKRGQFLQSIIVSDDITYPFPYLNGSTLKLGNELIISSHILLKIGCLSMLGFKLIHVNP